MLLVVSFGVWGVGDMVRTSAHNPTIANVGSVTITANDFARSLHQETENLRRVMGDNYSPDLMKNMNLSHWVLQRLINNALLRQETQAIGLFPSDSDVVRRIRSNPEFQDNKGNFDKRIFEAKLQNSGMSEKSFVEQMRQDMAIGILIDSITAVIPVSDTAVRTLLESREEQRSVRLYTLNTSLVGAVPEPDELKVQSYYDAHAREFTAPEYRSVSYVSITAADIPKDLKAPEEELKTMYNDRIEDFKRPERREVEQLLFASEDKARSASAMIKGGKSFAQVAKEFPILNKDSVSMGKIERDGLIENAVESVFTLPKDGVTDPIQSPFGWHIFHAVSIAPPSVLSFEEARPALEKDLKQHGSDQALTKLTNKFEDALAGGSTLQETARELNLKVLSVGPIDREGLSPDGTANKGIPNFDKFVETAFKTDEKTESQMITSKGGVFYVVRVDSVVPQHLRPLAEVKDRIVAGCQKEEREKRLSLLVAKEISAKFLNPADRAAVIAKFHLQSLPSADIKRGARAIQNVALPPALLNDIFSRKAGQGTQAYPAKEGGYLIAEVEQIIPTTLSDKNPKTVAALADIRKNLETSTQNEILDQYAHYLATKYPVSVNEAALQAVLK